METKNAKPASKDELATEIAKALGEEQRIDLYRHVFERHDEAVIMKAFDHVIKLPTEKIKKSKSALFFYLLNKYAEK
ncbi:MAG: hypothetical protein AB1746_00080 [Candidatus Zixiibacteriota bacterium]